MALVAAQSPDFRFRTGTGLALAGGFFLAWLSRPALYSSNELCGIIHFRSPARTAVISCSAINRRTVGVEMPRCFATCVTVNCVSM